MTLKKGILNPPKKGHRYVKKRPQPESSLTNNVRKRKGGRFIKIHNKRHKVANSSRDQIERTSVSSFEDDNALARDDIATEANEDAPTLHTSKEKMDIGEQRTPERLPESTSVEAEQRQTELDIAKAMLDLCSYKMVWTGTPHKRKSPKFQPKRYPWECISPKRKLRRRGSCLLSQEVCVNLSLIFAFVDVINLLEIATTACTDNRNSVESSVQVSSEGDISEIQSLTYSETTELLTTENCVEDDNADSDECDFGATSTFDENEEGRRSDSDVNDDGRDGDANCGSGPTKRSVGTQCNPDTESIGIQCDGPALTYHRCKNMKPEEFRFYTGITPDTFEALYDFFGGEEVYENLNYSKKDGTPSGGIRTQLLDAKGRMFMTLIRLRRGVPLRDLAALFKVSLSQASRIVYTWVRFMSLQFKVMQDRLFLSREAQNVNKPDVFKPFPNVRAIIDCTDFKTQKPFHFQMQSNTWSSYKSNNVLKYLIGDNVFGGICFISRGYEGSVSDKEIVLTSGFLDHLVPGDTIMCDRGFDIEAELNEIDVDLIMPAFLGNRKSFTAAELKRAQKIAKARIIIEITNKRIKDFRILHGTLPNKLLPLMDDLVLVCGNLSQFDRPFVDQKNLLEAIASLSCDESDKSGDELMSM